MSTLTRSALIAGLILAAGCATPIFDVVRAQPTGGSGGPVGSGGVTPHPQPGRFVASVDTRGLITVRDTIANLPVISPNSLSVANKTDLRVTQEFHAADGGFDVVIHYTNDTNIPLSLGCITLPGIRFEHEVEVGDFRHDAKFAEFDSNGTSFTTAGRDYPDDLYSPVGVISDGHYTVGMSLNYPILEYEHGVRVNFHVPGGTYGTSGHNWNGEYQLRGEMQPGESRAYTLAVRVVDHDSTFLHTLVPYRDYFQELYGGVRYERDPRPVLGFFISMNASLSPASPYGYDGSSRRPDTHGWGPWADFVRTAPDRGYERVMLWAPSGLFRQHTGNNFPFLFMSGMDNTPIAAQTAMLLKQRVADNGINLGFWWGRSSQVMKTWDTEGWEPLDPDNPDHVQRAFRELDLAVERGASTIGLDAFVYMDYWDGYRWLDMMLDRHPGLKFVIEPSGPDFQHVLAATWVEALHTIETPPLLQDFLIPGHETWANTRMDLYQYFQGVTPTDTIKNQYWQRMSDMGYVVMSYEQNTRMTGDWSAKEGWLINIPPTLLSDPRQWQSAGSLGGGGFQPDPEPEPDPNPDPGSGTGPEPEPEPDPEPGAGAPGKPPEPGAGGGATGGPSGGSGATTPPPRPPRVNPPRPSTVPPRISTNPITPSAAQQAILRQQQGGSTTSSVSGSGRGSATSLSDRLKERREMRRLARTSDERFQKRMERRQRLIARLGLQDHSYRERRTALQAYRSQQREQRATVATHPDSQD